MIDVEKILVKYFPVDESNQALQAAKYSLFSGGKRVRPILIIETAKLYGVFDSQVERLAAGIEMLHTYSLIHDDLPCMDNDDFRRGMPTCHKQFGETLAVLGGDLLLNLAFETFLQGRLTQNYFSAIEYIARASGYSGMVGGQSMDLTIDNPTKEQMLAISKLKTAKLISASIMPAAIYCNASKADQAKLSEFAMNFGLAFQIADDLLDYNEQKSNIDKEELINLLKSFTNKAQFALDQLNYDTRFFGDLLAKNVSRKK